MIPTPSASLTWTFSALVVVVWVAYAPFVWLPMVLVQAALMGHLLVLRKLLRERFE